MNKKYDCQIHGSIEDVVWLTIDIEYNIICMECLKDFVAGKQECIDLLKSP